MKIEYKTSGTCSRSITFDIDSDTRVVKNVSFLGGCNGNLQGISRMVEGLPASEVVSRLKGIKCGNKATSCPDQLACALQQALNS